MSTTAAAPTAAAQQTTVNPLDATIAATERRNVVSAARGYLGIDKGNVFDALRNQWKPTKGQAEYSDQELFCAVSLIGRFRLDPFAREIAVGRDKTGRIMTVLMVDGFIKILDRTDHYDGFEQSWEFDDKGQMASCTTTIYSTKRTHATVYTAFMSEYAKLAGFMYGKIPWHMLRIFSLRHATRLFTPMGGSVVTEEEARAMSQAEGQGTAPPDTLDDLADRLEQPAKSPGNGNGHTAPVDEQPTEPEPEETPQDEPEETRLLDEYAITINEAKTLGSNDGGCNEIEKNAHASFEAGDLTLKQHATILALLEAQRVKLRSSRGAGSNKAKAGATA